MNILMDCNEYCYTSLFPLQSSQGISIANVHLILHFKVTFVAILWVAIPSVMYVNILSVLQTVCRSEQVHKYCRHYSLQNDSYTVVIYIVWLLYEHMQCNIFILYREVNLLQTYLMLSTKTMCIKFPIGKLKQILCVHIRTYTDLKHSNRCTGT